MKLTSIYNGVTWTVLNTESTFSAWRKYYVDFYTPFECDEEPVYVQQI